MMRTRTGSPHVAFWTIHQLLPVLLLLFAGVMLTSATAVSAAPALPDSTPSPSAALAAMLNADGTLNLPPGYTGSLDIKGWDMVSNQGEPPRFAPRAPGDERWAAGFNPSGVNGTVNAIAVDTAGNIFIGGQFSAVGNILANNIAVLSGSTWSAVGNGVSGSVNALAYDPATNTLYAGGYFTYVCAQPECTSFSTQVNRVAKWSAGAWSAVGNGFYGQPVNALAWNTTSNRLFAGGAFQYLCNDLNCAATGTQVNYIAQLTGGAWATVGNGLNNTVLALSAVVGAPNVYAGGLFTAFCTLSNCSTSTPAMYVARWAGAWTQMIDSGINGTNGAVNAVYWAPALDSLFLAGEFTSAGNISGTNHIARWNTGTSSYYALSLGVKNNVQSLFWDNAHNTLYVGGDITGWCTDAACTTSSPANRVGKWDNTGATWSALGSGVDSTVLALALNAGVLYAGGSFAFAGSTVATGIARWNVSGAAWTNLYAGNTVDAVVQTVIADGAGNVYAAGLFHTAGGSRAFGIARWNGQSRTWSAMGYGVMGIVYAFAIDRDGNLIVGGSFNYLCGNAQCTAPGLVAHNLAKWNRVSGSWSPIAYGIIGMVRALATDRDGNIYVGGSIPLICNNADCSSNSPVFNIVKYSASTGLLGWSDVGIAGVVLALALGPDNSLYAGGIFNTLCLDAACSGPGTQVNNIARWNGSWSPLEKGLKGQVQALGVDSSGNLYAGGMFVYACGTVDCLTNGTRLNEVGKFASGGSAWGSLAGGLAGAVYALTVDEKNNLFVGGVLPFACPTIDCAAPGTMIANISRWNGTAWDALGSGIATPIVFGITARQGVLSVGGAFSEAGGKVAANFAQYTYGYFDFLPYLAR